MKYEAAKQGKKRMNRDFEMMDPEDRERLSQISDREREYER